MKYKKINPNAIDPEYKTPGSAGADLCSTKRVIVRKNQVSRIPLGIGFDIPDGNMIQLSVRSSTAFSKNVFSPNGVGIIDSDYKGEVSLLLTALDEDYIVNVNERIAQAVLVKISSDCTLEEVKELKTTVRGDGGFGSTGL